RAGCATSASAASSVGSTFGAVAAAGTHALARTGSANGATNARSPRAARINLEADMEARLRSAAHYVNGARATPVHDPRPARRRPRWALRHSRQHPSIVVLMSTRHVCVPFCVVMVSFTTLLPLNSIAAFVVVLAAASGMT